MPSAGTLTLTLFETEFGDDKAILEGSALKVIEDGGVRPSHIVKVGSTLKFQVDLEYRGESLAGIGERTLKGTVFIEGLGKAVEIDVPFTAVNGVDADGKPKQTLTTDSIDTSDTPDDDELGPGLYRVGAVVEEGPDDDSGHTSMSGFLDYIMVKITK